MTVAGLRPLMRLWMRVADSNLTGVPRPEGAPHCEVAGDDPLRVLLMGNGPAVGWGVRTHDLALPGHIARDLARRTGRGVHVETRADPNASVETVARQAAALESAPWDAIVVVTGVSDAISLIPVPRWRAAIATLLDDLAAATPPGTPVLLMGIQPVRSVSVYAGAPGAVAERHAERLNRVSRELCAERAHAIFSPLQAPLQPPSRPGHRAPSVYGEWAATIVAPLVPHLARSGAADDAAQEAHPGRS